MICRLDNKSDDFKKGYWMCWLFITKQIQSKVTKNEVRDSENLHYKIRCLEEDNRLLQARNESLKASMTTYKNYFKENNKKLV